MIQKSHIGYEAKGNEISIWKKFLHSHVRCSVFHVRLTEADGRLLVCRGQGYGRWWSRVQSFTHMGRIISGDLMYSLSLIHISEPTRPKR